ncbi:M48 family metalloprotease [Marinobacterium litorale]|uniref:M48 family metalloprotease n=1 Tax=Marinobacterium litorale TaxID=404770 RepID=UPI000424D10A|nr:M48 family metalloprotease [Marinobacterium litorale]
MNKQVRLITLVAITALAGCKTDTLMTKVSDFMPGGFNDETPYIQQLTEARGKALNGVGVDADRLRTQSEGRGLIDAPSVEQLMNDHLARLKKASNIEDIEGQAYISAEKGFAARTSADGNIYIPMGMLSDLENSHQLAALLAHELSHAILNHSNSDMLVTLQKKALLFTQLTGQFNNDNNEIAPSDKRRIRNVMAMTLVSDGFLNPGWTRGQEEDADRLGLDLLVAAGYNPEAMNEVLLKLDAWHTQNQAIKNTHEERQKALEASVGATDLNAQLNNSLEQLTQSLGKVLTSFSESHPSPEERIEALKSYVSAHYRRAGRPPMSNDSWTKTINSRETKALIRAISAVSDAEQALAKNQTGDALQTVLGQINSYTKEQNFIRQSLIDIRDAQGKNASVMANIRYGLEGRYPSFRLTYEQLLRSNDRTPDASLLTKLTDSFNNYGKPPAYYPQLISIADQMDNKLMKTALMTECRLNYAGEAVACQPNESAQDQEISYTRFVNQLL